MTHPVVPTIFGHRMRPYGRGAWKAHLGVLRIQIWSSLDADILHGQACPFYDSFCTGTTAIAVSSKLEAWVVRHLLGKTLGALGFEARRVRS